MDIGFPLRPLAQKAELRNFVAGDGQIALRLEIDFARVLDVQFVQLRADLAPDARLFRGVVDERWAEPFQPVLAAQGEQVLPPLDVTVIAEAGVARLEFEFGYVGRNDHGLGVDLRAVLDERIRSVHHPGSCGRGSTAVPTAALRVIVSHSDWGPAVERLRRSTRCSLRRYLTDLH